MELAELAARFVDSENAERERLLHSHRHEDLVGLGYALKDICLTSWSGEPARATRAAEALHFLAKQTDHGEVAACEAWCAGIAALVAAQMESAIEHLDIARARFIDLDLPQKAAATQVSKLIALATVGRYDDAIECGLGALSVLEAHGDILSAGKIEHNIGNIYWRRDHYVEAERYFRAARARFDTLKDDLQLATLDNCLGYIQSLKHDFRSAEELYDQALKRAEAGGLTATQAGIESSLGNLALFQGRYDRALDFLEKARRRYSEMGMPHETAISELEIANAYLELNLGPEAAELYQRVTPVFAQFSMRAEQAFALAHHGKAAILLGEIDEAQRLLKEARAIYAAEGNKLGESMVVLTMAQMHNVVGNFPATILAAEEAEGPLSAAGVWRHSLMARWLRGEAAYGLGLFDEAHEIITTTLDGAIKHAQPQVAQRCHTSLGLISYKNGDAEKAENSFKRSIELIETLRAPLPAEEFRTAYFSDKLVPYDEMVRLCLADKRDGRIGEALGFVERARSRALVELMGGELAGQSEPRDDFEANLLTQLEGLRRELNWFYSQINRPKATGDVSVTANEMAELHSNVLEREKRILEITRQLQHRAERKELVPQAEMLDLAGLQSALGAGSTLVEYTVIDHEYVAFVVTNDSIQVVQNLGSEAEVESLLTQLRFQIDTLRFGADRMRKHLSHLTTRALGHLTRLYDLLLAPLSEYIDNRRLVVVPHRLLHYVPFHALHDGSDYVIEKREVSYAPSAAVLYHCLLRKARRIERALLIGVPDEQAPRVLDEVRELEPLFESATTLLDGDATLSEIRKQAPGSNVLHLACHGQFRPDNPRFSSLRLAGDWMTMRDASSLDLRECEVVSLSACETGVNAVTAGNELIGLTRGFLSAGAPSLLISMWTVDDATTADLMVEFYSQMSAGASAASALRYAQLKVMKENPHPFFWSPFVLFGRW